MLDFADILWIVHPALAVIVVFPLIGIVVRQAWLTRQRRLQIAENNKSKIPPVAGQEHVEIGRWLSGSVVGLALIGLAVPIFTKMSASQVWTTEPFRFTFVLAIFAATIASLVILYKARTKIWRAVFATLTGMGVILLGCQPEIFRRGDFSDVYKQLMESNPAWMTTLREMLLSHYYYGIIVTMLMIFSLAIVQDIYQDRKNRWRTVHIVLNSIALLLFISQGITGSRDLLEIPLNWQKPAIYKCDFVNKTCG